jgi:hypothetical protein
MGINGNESGYLVCFILIIQYNVITTILSPLSLALLLLFILLLGKKIQSKDYSIEKLIHKD